MKKIAIIGACCSRDLYNSKFVSNWKEYADVVYYSFQTSFISIMATPIPYSRSMIDLPVEGYNEWYRDILTRELEKTFCNDLLSLCPDNIVIDFYSDIVNGVWEVNGGESYITRRTALEQNSNIAFRSIYDKKPLILLSDYDKYMALWKQGINNFLLFLEKYLHNTRLIINYPRFSNQLLHSDGTVTEYGNKDVERYNELYTEMVGYVKNVKQDIFIADLNKTYYINPDYIFGGAWIVHYQNEYYQDLINLIYSLCVDDVPSKKNIDRNLLINSSGEIGTQYFKYFDDSFFIGEEDGKNHFEFFVNRNNASYQQVWSHDIALDGLGISEYTIRFKCRVSSNCPFESSAILLVRAYNKQNKVLKADAVQQYAVQWDGTYDEFKDYSITISPNGKYMSVGLYCDTSGHISWKDISVVKGIGGEKIEKNFVSEQLIKEKKLIDMNRLPLYK